MKLSVIIPCKNEATTVIHLLDSLVQQTTQPFEVVVVDSYSTDDTVHVVKSYQDKLPIKVVTATGKKNLIATRNEGAASALGEVFLFIDADVTLPPRFIEELGTQMNTKSLDVGGFSQRMPSTKLGLRVGARMMNGYVRIMSYTPWPIFFSCFFITKAVHKKINGFDPAIWIMEDYDYAYRAKKSGARFGLIKNTYFTASPRRYEENSSVKGILQGVYAEIYRYTHGMRVTKPLYTYDMGGKDVNKTDKDS
jgi:glycosyltransferase involved in cell wall biosynthesis